MTSDQAKRGGLKHMAAAAFFFSIMSLLVRLAGARLPASMLVLARAAVALALSFALVRRAGLSPWGNNRRLLFVRGLLGFAALSCFYYALTRLPLAEATVIQYTNPVFVAVLAALLLGEKLRAREAASVLVSLAGVVLVTRPGFLFGQGAAPLDPGATTVAVAGAVFSAFAYVAVRKSSGKDHPLVVVLWFPLVATPLAVPLAVKEWVWPTPLEWLLLVAIGVATQTAQVFMTEGLHREPAGRATAASYLQVAFAVGWGLLVLREVPDVRTVAGALLIGGSVLALGAFSRRP